jgi:hypothetical protein
MQLTFRTEGLSQVLLDALDTRKQATCLPIEGIDSLDR